MEKENEKKNYSTVDGLYRPMTQSQTHKHTPYSGCSRWRKFKYEVKTKENNKKFLPETLTTLCNLLLQKKKKVFNKKNKKKPKKRNSE